MKKVLSIACIALILTALLLPTVYASDSYLLLDNAGLLSESEAAEVEKELLEVSNKYNYDVAVLTVDNYRTDFGTEFSDIKDAALYYCQEYLSQNSVVFVISMDERDGAIQTNPDGKLAFTQYGREYIVDQVREKVSDGEYKEAFLQYTELADDFLAEAEKGTPYDTNHKVMGFFDYLIRFGIPLIAGLVIAIIALLAVKKRYKPVQLKAEANDYLIPGSLQVHNAYDRFIYTHVTRTAKPKNNSSGGSSSNNSGGTSFKF